MSRWTHSLCDECYAVLQPGREPSRIVQADMEACCRCCAMHQSGIYYRANPEHMACGGKHD